MVDETVGGAAGGGKWRARVRRETNSEALLDIPEMSVKTPGSSAPVMKRWP